MKTRFTRREFIFDTIGATAILILPNVLFSKEYREQAGRKACFLYDDIYLQHDTGNHHPEAAGRLIAVNKSIKIANWYNDLILLKAEAPALETISLVHDKNYIETVKKECEAGFKILSTGDTNISKQSYLVALHAVGGVLKAVDMVMEGRAKNAFCAIRPPGHHASQMRGMGFCIFNNVSIAARYAQKKYNIERVLIADWDVHHGNGTQDIFYTDNTVFFMSTHQWPWYPGTGSREEIGEGKGKGFTMNRLFPAGTGNKEIIGVFKNDLLSVAKNYRPELTLISAGFDSRKGDPLGHFEIDDEGFRELTKIMLEVSHIAGNGRLISILEGGYNLQGLAPAVSAHMDELSKA